MAQESTSQDHPVQSSIDFNIALRFPNGKMLLALSGWIVVRRLKGLAVDSSGSPSLLNTRYCPRQDVDKIFGSCPDETRAGHGFTGYTVCTYNDVARLYASLGNNIVLVQQFAPAIAEDKNEFLKNLASAPIDPEQKRRLERDLLEVMASLPAVGNEDIPVESDVIGITPVNPAISLIVAFDGDEATLETQALALLEDPMLGSGIELIYVLYGKNHAELSSRVTQLYSEKKIPVSVISPASPVEKARACNMGADVATGSILAFIDELTIPDYAGLLQALSALLVSSNALAACGAKDILDRQLNTLYSIETDGDTGEIFSLSLPDSIFAQALENGQNVFPKNGLVITGGEWFRRLGGFDGGYQDMDMALADYCAKARAAGGNLIFDSSNFFHRLPAPGGVASLGKKIDDARFKKHWKPAESN